MSSGRSGEQRRRQQLGIRLYAVGVRTVLGKRARFVRYWVNGHEIAGPNLRDQWKQIYAWFDEFLMKPDDTKPKKP